MSRQPGNQIKYMPYVLGFVISIFLTVEAYLLTTNRVIAGKILVIVLLSLAVVQFFVQMYFFLHLGNESKPRWRTLSFAMMLCVVLILVLGSLWIMYNLDYNHNHLDGQSKQQYINQYLDSQDGL